MNTIELFILFLIGSISGYVIEAVYRNLAQKQKINPGFLKGPYLPIYGFAIIILFLISEQTINPTYKIILFLTIPTAMELTTGVIFRKYFRIKLWDYSKDPLNFKGIICLQFSIYWAAMAIFYYFVLHALTKSHFLKILTHTSYVFIYGIAAGIFLLDVAYSFNIAFKIRKAVKTMEKKAINFTKFKDMSDIFSHLKIKIKKLKIKPKNKLK